MKAWIGDESFITFLAESTTELKFNRQILLVAYQCAINEKPTFNDL